MPGVKVQKRKSLYSVHPSVAMMVKWVAELKAKTGRSLEEWVAFVKKSGPPTEAERRDWLKKAHGLGTNASWWIAEITEGKGDDYTPEKYLAAAERYVEEMFAGSEVGLRPIYEELLKLGRSMGKDVKFCPCKTIVPFYRNHVIAEVKPSTRTRLDFGVALGDTPAKGHLIDTGGFKKKNRITHRFALTKIDDIDAEVEHWLRVAYDRDA